MGIGCGLVATHVAAVLVGVWICAWATGWRGTLAQQQDKLNRLEADLVQFGGSETRVRERLREIDPRLEETPDGFFLSRAGDPFGVFSARLSVQVRRDESGAVTGLLVQEHGFKGL